MRQHGREPGQVLARRPPAMKHHDDGITTVSFRPVAHELVVGNYIQGLPKFLFNVFVFSMRLLYDYSVDATRDTGQRRVFEELVKFLELTD